MAISMYKASIPVFIHVLENLMGIVDKGATYAESKKIDPAILINARLYPNMYTFARQIQIATDMSKGCAARLAGQDPPSYSDNECSFAELRSRLEKTIAFLKTFTADQIDGTEEKSVNLKVGGQPKSFQGLPYLTRYVLPNLYFHTSIAYAILRHNGVELAKKDYLGNLPS